MALVKGTNSYVTVAEADDYFADRLDVAAWTSADSTQKAQALVSATAMLDQMNWTGVAISESQKLAFPRSGSYFDPKYGAVITLTDATPDRVLSATNELAYHLLNNDGLMDDTGGAKSISVGQIRLDFVEKPNKVPSSIRTLIKPLLLNQGSNSWWRAN